jgi:hypothetical protein
MAMTGLLTQAAATEHLHELRAAAGDRDHLSREQQTKRRRAAFGWLHRPRRALAA